MPEYEEPNPYEPPSGESVPERTPAHGMAAQSAGDVPGRVWSIFRQVLDYANGINLVVAIVVAQLAVNLVQQVPNLMMGRTSINPMNPQAGGQPDVPEEMLPIAFGAMCLAGLGGFVLNFIISSLARPIRLMYYRGPREVSSISEAVSIGWERIFHILAVALLWGLMSGVGFIFCILPGLVLALISWIPVYISATTDLGVMDCIKRSLDVAQRQWQSIAVMMLVTLGAGLVVFCPIGFLQLVPAVGIILGAVGSAVVAGIAWLWVPSVMLAIEERDREIFGSEIWDDPTEPSPQSARPSSGSEW